MSASLRRRRRRYFGTLFFGSNSSQSPPRQLFLRLPCDDVTETSAARVSYLEKNVLKVINNAAFKKILLYCDNYFEYVYVKRLLMENCDERECGVIDEWSLAERFIVGT